MKLINVGIVGLGFGKEFIPIYQRHPNVGKIAICIRSKDALMKISEEYDIPVELCYTDYYEMIKNDDLDAIHIVTPVPLHYEMSLAALQAGKHTACTIPMATTLEQCKNLVEAKNKSGKVYMMMETALYTREFFYVNQMKKTGDFGKIQFIRTDHLQNMGLPGWDEYWKGFPPFLNGTHALSPALALVGKKPKSVVCHASGKLVDTKSQYDTDFAVVTATFDFYDTDVAVESTRWINDTIRQYREAINVYGSKASFEWEQLIDEKHVIYTGFEDAARIDCPDTDAVLPPEIADFAKRNQVADKEHKSFIQGAGHGGSHPHLVHEFISAIVENRDSKVDAAAAATITSCGICAHLSATNNSERIDIPTYGEYILP